MIQCFPQKVFTPAEAGGAQPHLRYVCKIDPEASVYPRVMHAHEDFVEVCLILSGSSQYMIQGQTQKVAQGDIVVYNSGDVHDEISGVDSVVGSYCVAIGGLCLDGLRENALTADEDRHVYPAGDVFPILQGLCESLYQTLCSGAARAEETAHYIMMAYLSQVQRICTGGGDDPQAARPGELSSELKAYIDLHYMKDITFQGMADRLHYNPCYLSHAFKKAWGYSPMQYLLRRRIGEAQTLLINSNDSITHIAQAVGFDSPSYFNMQFLKNVGLSPSKYRNSYVGVKTAVNC